MNPTNCLNCNKEIIESSKFCSQCGQNTHIHRFTLKHFFHEFFHAFTHTDKGIFHLLKCLAIRPGTTAREYITGKRKSYFNPFTFFLILMAIFVISNNFFAKPVPVRPVSQEVLNRIPTEEGKKNYVQTLNRGNKANVFMRKNGNIIAMIAVPFISLFTWLFFRRSRFNYAEHLTANMMFVAFSNLIFTLIIFPLIGWIGNKGLGFGLTFIAMLLQGIYLGWALNGFLQLKTFLQRFKSMSVAILTIFLWAIVSVMSVAFYIYQNSHFLDFFTRMRAGA
ncbi:MAG TPA: DUF3667 domain-containing protein [Ferruginibacter sp.]|nr:DUF3667 domain-containing protein [Ferruginibacter sp.]HRE64832.1 DUF3667 domain-containing protein [Ferruginibacter sp.]